MLKIKTIFFLKEVIFWVVILVILWLAAWNFQLFSKYKFWDWSQKNNSTLDELLQTKIWGENRLLYWFSVVDILGKELQIVGVDNAVLNARMANLFKDLVTSTPGIASEEVDIAVYRFLLHLYPHSQIYLERSLKKIGFENKYLEKSTLEILDKHLKNYKTELQEVQRENNKYTLNGKWKLIRRIGEPSKPLALGAGQYLKSRNYFGFEYKLQEPKYNQNELVLQQEINQLTQNLQKQNEWLERILYWNAGPGSQGISYILQNKLFTENCQLSSAFFATEKCPKNFLSKQVELANLVADAYIMAVENKYKFQTLRPENAIANYTNPIRTPKQPGFPSDLALVCSAVSNFFLDKNFLNECVESRYYAGVEFPADILAGVSLGEALSEYVISAE